jgi:PTH1 family peptidyl-tRNA hydrolase
LVLIVGLGNPGAAYEDTRHNAGFMVIDRLTEAHAIKCDRIGPGRSFLWGRGVIEGVEVVLAKPLTFVNRSGTAVSELLRALDITPGSLIVVCDDCDLPPGCIRIRKKGGSGGHKGLESVIEYLDTEDFPRVRIGVGRPPGGEEELRDYVLSPFSPEEKRELGDFLKRAAASIETILGTGIDHAMNVFN